VLAGTGSDDEDLHGSEAYGPLRASRRPPAWRPAGAAGGAAAGVAGGAGQAGMSITRS
jgi:hypothetical protein